MSQKSNGIDVVAGDPREPQATALLQASHALMQQLFSEEENHYLSIDELCIPSIRFLVAKEGDTTLGCVALANKGAYGEIKSMFVDPAARGKGISHKLMQHLDAAARAQGLAEIKLETGDKLKEAHSLYRAHGFVDCGPFGDYEANSSSIFMTKTLD
ncbi:GNAT family N-acetyltransferase [Shimia sp. R10_1]|uniref:GNAT family N-acetyltransferase n=1 Tax=Shimia sp. R10_1 TaxID=2821095 RepID=UPI001ADBE3EA|nr:GNAT family N-acetyltransferase [Shimia sp. R10_1]MBO9472999.1 GNAT family N-acetyltransferase [Shimia sp. R10_1]